MDGAFQVTKNTEGEMKIRKASSLSNREPLNSDILVKKAEKGSVLCAKSRRLFGNYSRLVG